MKNISLIDPLQDPRWDNFVEQHPFGWICHLSGWQSVMERCFMHIKGCCLAIVDDDKQQIVAAMPLYKVNSWLTGNRLVSVPFATINDLLVSSTKQAEDLLNAALDLSIELNISDVEISTLMSGKYIQKSFFNRYVTHKRHYICLDLSLESILHSFHESCVQRRIKKSIKSGIIARLAVEEEDIKKFYRVYLLTRKKLGLPPQPYRFFYSLWKNFTPLNYITILLAEINGNIIGGVLLYKFKTRLSCEVLVYDSKYTRLCPSHFLWWHTIKIAKEEGYRIMDFGRTSVFSEGVMVFKNRWGTDVIDLPIYQFSNKNEKAFKPRERSLIYNTTRKIIRKCPKPIFKLMGEYIYRHLS